MNIINDNTPLEAYEVNTHPEMCPTSSNRTFTVYVKREDLSTNPPAPKLAKLRGVYKRMLKLKEAGITEIGVLDTRVSKSGWGVAAIAQELGNYREIGGFHVTQYIPWRKNDVDLPENCGKAKNLNSDLIKIPAGRLAIVYSRASKMHNTLYGDKGFMMPMGLVVPESVYEVRDEAIKTAYARPEIFNGEGCIVMAVGSGMSIAGVALGMRQYVKKVYGVSAGMSNKRQESRIKKTVGIVSPIIELIPPIDGYYDSAEAVSTPFESSIWYDKKAWRWLMQNICTLPQPIIFWNIGV